MFQLSLIFLIPTFVFSANVQIEQGTLSGLISKSRGGVEFYSFFAIPFAQPPVGELRFQPPHGPAPKWQGVKNATVKPPECIQMKMQFGPPGPHNHEMLGSEDCLYLNVFTPKLGDSDGKLLPVLVFIHGGGFGAGTGNWAIPDYFLDKPIVLVGINYRLGVLGFFATGETTASGNYGLKDQTEALKWIQKNIKAFGGDPNSVSIMGQSAGAGSVQFHTFSPLSKGLFHKVLLHSGIATPPFAISTKQDAHKKAENFFQFTKCNVGTITEKIACLRKIPAAKLRGLEYAMNAGKHQQGPPASFNPTVEDKNVENAFLTRHPKERPYERTPEVPSIWGFTANESAHFAEEYLIRHPKLTEGQLHADLPNLVHYNFLPRAMVQNVTAQINKIYFKDNFKNVNADTLNKLLTDFYFKFQIIDEMKHYTGSRYFFEYDYQNNGGFPGFGAQHSEDLRSFFPRHDFLPLTDEDNKLSKVLISYWVNFITSGNPNHSDEPIEWTQMTNSALDYLHISKDGLAVKKYHQPEKEALWNYITSAHPRQQRTRRCEGTLTAC